MRDSLSIAKLEIEPHLWASVGGTGSSCCKHSLMRGRVNASRDGSLPCLDGVGNRDLKKCSCSRWRERKGLLAGGVGRIFRGS